MGKILFLIVCLSILACQHLSQASEQNDLLAKSAFAGVDLPSKVLEAKQKVKRSAKEKKKERKSRKKQRSQEIQSQKWGEKIVNKNLEEEVIRIQDEARKAKVTKIKEKKQR